MAMLQIGIAIRITGNFEAASSPCPTRSKPRGVAIRLAIGIAGSAENRQAHGADYSNHGNVADNSGGKLAGNSEAEANIQEYPLRRNEDHRGSHRSSL